MFYTGDIKGKKILLHACCGPCSLGAIEPLLEDGADVALYFYNPCIVDGEFDLRLAAIEAVARHYGIELAVPPHDYGSYKEYASAYADSPEGGERCALCMKQRLEFAAVYAKAHGFDAYTTTLTVSPHKNSKLIFSLAQALDDSGIGASFLARDFKKRDGFLLSVRRARELDIYRQKFCGCEYSRHDGCAVQGGGV